MPTPNARARSAAGGSAANSARKSAETHDLLNYRLSERLNQEELATVYRATHLTLDRPVQVHILRRTDWISSSRFQLAARLAARLQHTNILPVIDAGHDDRYGDYLVTPRLEMHSLQSVLQNGALDPVTALKVFSQIGAALDYLHGENVIHRDVQPANIYLTPQGIAYLGNFSLAAAPDTPDLSSLEEDGYLTPYSAPEQSLVNGNSAAAQDLYSLGAVLYHMLLGEPPPMPGGELLSIATRNANLADADRVIRRLLSTQPSQRYASAAQATIALRQALRQQIDDSTEDMQESRWETVAEWLENPLETVVGDVLDQEFVGKSRARTDQLHRAGALPRLLDRWSQQGFLRQPSLGQIVQPTQIVSYDVYLYELKAHYETRLPPEKRITAPSADATSAAQREPELWDAPVPDLEPFIDAVPEPIPLPGSRRLVPCSECNGAANVACTTCAGQGQLERTRKVKEADGTTRQDTFSEQCPTCHGYGKQTCRQCEGSGQMQEEKVFMWSRQGRQYLNEDDLTGLHKLTIQTHAQEVYHGRINPYDARWHQVAPLKELLEEAIKGAGPNSRLLVTDLAIRGVPVTEIDYTLGGQQHSLTVIGFENEVRGDSSLYNRQQAILYGLIIILALLSLFLIITRFL